MVDRHSPRKRLRWWWVLACLVLALGGLWGWRQQVAHGALHLVTKRTFPTGIGVRCSAGGIGYPAVENERPITDLQQPVRLILLDDRCRPTRWKTGSNLAISPRRGTVMWCDFTGSDGLQVHLLARDGSKNTSTYQVINRGLSPWSITEDGRAFALTDNDVFTAAGKRVPLPRGCIPAWSWICDDSRYLALRNNKDDTLYLYDWAKQRVTLTIPHNLPYSQCAGVIFTDQQRTAIIPAQGQGMIYDGVKRIAVYGNSSSYLVWGEDGTVWNWQDYTCIRWRRGPVASFRIPFDITFDTDYYPATARTYFNDTAYTHEYGWGEAWPALWHDGELGASAQTVSLLPERAQTLVYRLGQKMKRPLHERFIGRELTLYRHGKPIGRYAIRPPKPLPRTVAAPPDYAEHLAFTADGRHLCWLVQSSGHPLQMYVFRVR